MTTISALTITTSTAVGLLRASHVAPAIAVTAIATALAVSVGRGVGVVTVTSAVAAGQLAVGWSNDYIDRDRDRRSGRLDKPIVAGQVLANTVRSAAIMALVACLPLSLLSGWRAGLLHLSAVAAALTYNAGLKSTVASPVPYAIAFGILPAFVTLGLPGHPLPPLWAVVAAATLARGAHFINTLGDQDDDIRLGVFGMPQRLGRTTSLAVGASLLAGAVAVLAFGPRGHPGAAVILLFAVTMLLVLGVVVSARSKYAHIAWPLTLTTALIAVALLITNGKSLA